MLELRVCGGLHQTDEAMLTKVPTTGRFAIVSFSPHCRKHRSTGALVWTAAPLLASWGTGSKCGLQNQPAARLKGKELRAIPSRSPEVTRKKRIYRPDLSLNSVADLILDVLLSALGAGG